jgi:two-component system LytT family response regulator
MIEVNVLIVDDEPAARRRIRQLLHLHEGVRSVQEASTVREAAKAVALSTRDPIDLVLLDVMMPGGEGFAFFGSLPPEANPVVVFVTAHADHATRAFAVHATDYILKPVDEERFGRMMLHVREALARQREHRVVRRLERMLDIPGCNVRDPLAIRQKGRVALVPIEQIEWVDAARSRSRIRTAKETFVSRESISELELRLPPSEFVRIHRSTIVNLQSVSEVRLDPKGQYQAVLKSGQRLSVGRLYRRELRRRVGMEGVQASDVS